MAELKNYDAPWYDDLAAYVTALLHGPNANAQQYAGVEKFTGPQNPFNAPAQMTRGVNTAVDGYGAGNYGQMASGALEAALAAGMVAAPAVGTLARMTRDPRMARHMQNMHSGQASAYGPQQPGRTPPIGGAGIPAAPPRASQPVNRFDFTNAPASNVNTTMGPLDHHIQALSYPTGKAGSEAIAAIENLPTNDVLEIARKALGLPNTYKFSSKKNAIEMLKDRHFTNSLADSRAKIIDETNM